MKNTAIRIRTNDKKVLSCIISNNISYLSSLNWTLLFLEGTYVDDDSLMLEDQVSESPHGLPISFNTVSTLIGHVNDLWNLLLIGQLERNTFEKNLPDEYLFEKYNLVIEFFDSTYWTVASNNINFINNVKCDLAKAYSIEPLSM